VKPTRTQLVIEAYLGIGLGMLGSMCGVTSVLQTALSHQPPPPALVTAYYVLAGSALALFAHVAWHDLVKR